MAGVYGYSQGMTKYAGTEFETECRELCGLMGGFFRVVCTLTTRITEEVVGWVFKIAQHVRSCMYPEEILEEFYLHIICFQE